MYNKTNTQILSKKAGPCGLSAKFKNIYLKWTRVLGYSKRSELSQRVYNNNLKKLLLKLLDRLNFSNSIAHVNAFLLFDIPSFWEFVLALGVLGVWYLIFYIQTRLVCFELSLRWKLELEELTSCKTFFSLWTLGLIWGFQQGWIVFGVTVAVAFVAHVTRLFVYDWVRFKVGYLGFKTITSYPIVSRACGLFMNKLGNDTDIFWGATLGFTLVNIVLFYGSMSKLCALYLVFILAGVLKPRYLVNLVCWWPLWVTCTIFGRRVPVALSYWTRVSKEHSLIPVFFASSLVIYLIYPLLGMDPSFASSMTRIVGLMLLVLHCVSTLLAKAPGLRSPYRDGIELHWSGGHYRRSPACYGYSRARDTSPYSPEEFVEMINYSLDEFLGHYLGSSASILHKS